MCVCVCARARVCVYCFGFCCCCCFLAVVDAPHVDVRAWTLCCCHSLLVPKPFQRELTAFVDGCAVMKSTPVA